jgi:hypothetical protein
VLRDALNSLTGNPRYLDIIKSYFADLEALEIAGLEKRYERVLSILTNLWVDSNKNPSIFREAKDFEPILQKNPIYRDHFIHSFNVFVLGYCIINKLHEIHPSKNFFGATESEWNLTWMLTSTFHDVAYPVQETESWLSDLFEAFLGVNPKISFNITQIMPPIYTDFMRMLSRYHRHYAEGGGPFLSDDLQSIDWLFYNELSSGLMAKNHGVLGALMLCHRMAIREGFLDPRPLDFLRTHLPACHAISLHDLKSFPVTFGKYPFAFMLILCDELQDWGRPSKRVNPYVIDLKKVTVGGSSIPEIQFEINASNERRLEVDKVLKVRLPEDNRVKIVLT